MDKKFNWFKSSQTGRLTCRLPEKEVPPIFPVGTHGVTWQNANLLVTMDIYEIGADRFAPYVHVLNTAFGGGYHTSEAEAVKWCEENVGKLVDEVVNAAGRVQSMIKSALNGEKAEIAEWEGG